MVVKIIPTGPDPDQYVRLAEPDPEPQVTVPQAEPDLNLEPRKPILAAIERLTQPYPPPTPWTALRGRKSGRQLCGQPDELVSELLSEFTSEQLLVAGVVRQAPGGPLKLSRIFGNSASGFFLRRDAERSPINAISSRGVLTGTVQEWLNLAAAQNEVNKRDSQNVLLAFNDPEMFVYHRLGLKYTPAAGLDRVSGADVSKLIAARPKPVERCKFVLVLVGWQAASCVNKPTAKVLQTLEHFCAIQPAYGLDPGEVFRVWLPTDDDCKKVRRALAFSDADKVTQVLQGSLEKCTFTPSDAQIILRDRRALSYGDARQRLERTIYDSYDFPLVAQASVDLAKLTTAFRKSVVDKLLAANDCGDPWEKFRSLQAADLAEIWFDKLDIVRAGRAVAAAEHPGIGSFDERLLDDRLRITDACIKLQKQYLANRRGR